MDLKYSKDCLVPYFHTLSPKCHRHLDYRKGMQVCEQFFWKKFVHKRKLQNVEKSRLSCNYVSLA